MHKGTHPPGVDLKEIRTLALIKLKEPARFIKGENQ
jgi:hypothetical protein